MRITGLRPQKRNPRRISVYLDGAFAFSISQELASELGLKKGLAIDRQRLEELIQKERLRKCQDYALLLLSYRARTKAELAGRLERKGYPKEVVSAVVGRLEELGLLDDAAFARAFTEDRINIGHKGKWRVRAELMKRGVDRKEIEAALKEAPDETEAARMVVQHYQSRYRRLDPKTRKRRLYGLLARRGFSTETIQTVLGIEESET
ncbi:MAG: RecX family transcriptional regulator [candidate division WOR-3 bacterium]